MSQHLKLNSNTVEALQFYLDNDLCEIISEKPRNHFLEKSPQKKPVQNLVSTTATNFIKPQTSTNEALSILAKKSQPTSAIEPAFDDKKFKSLNEILTLATKAAKAAKNLSELRQAVENFEGCNLKKMATNTVFCDGNANSKVMVIGEAPGNHEDLQGIPFCGDSGKVLDEMFGAIKMTRAHNFYVTNVLFWRPPGNRRPTEEELAICRPFVERHIELVAPEVLVLVGATAMTAILAIKDPVTQIRGKFMDFSPKFLSKKIKTFTIFHPSYLMRQPSKKKVAWQDMLALEEFLK
jgi:uracil-DNA glycosylase